ncbi:hypothetical protein NQZ68_035866 [Dissostichus eleginoides]|nr:hypothetical protein NQZ68_035866 [Dissostichus eleginoides]
MNDRSLNAFRYITVYGGSSGVKTDAESGLRCVKQVMLKNNFDEPQSKVLHRVGFPRIPGG